MQVFYVLHVKHDTKQPESRGYITFLSGFYTLTNKPRADYVLQFVTHTDADRYRDWLKHFRPEWQIEVEPQHSAIEYHT